MYFYKKNLFSFFIGTTSLIFLPFNKVSANPISITVNETSYSVGTNQFSNYESDISILKDQIWWGNSSLAVDFSSAVDSTNGLTLVDGETCCGPIFAVSEPESQKLLFVYAANGSVVELFLNRSIDFFWGDGNGGSIYYYAYLAQSDMGMLPIQLLADCMWKDLSAAVSVNDPDGNGTVTSYTWQASSDGSTWSNINGETSSTFTVTDSEEGKYIRVIVAYTDGEGTSESVTSFQ